MKVLVDLNVLLDVIQRREPHYAASADLLSRMAEGELQGSIPGHALTTIYYIVSRFAGRASADEAVDWILGDLEVVPEGRGTFLRARSLQIEDLEDAVVAAAAEQSRSDRIATRNVDDFEHSPVSALTPLELLAELEPPPEPEGEEPSESEGNGRG
ncbi:MAG: type II toxin-antitoxin system VapC family toxin [Thermoanaerobaculia bacterium]